MYLEFYHLASLPFENTPDPRFFFASEQHREALAAIEYTIRMRKGFALITGDIGSGKTTVGRIMCDRCGDQATIVQVLPGHHSSQSLLRQVLRSLGVTVNRRDDYGDMVERLRERLMDHLEQDRPVVLFVDEAQTLSDEALEALRLLGNLDTAVAKPIQIVLVGQPELRQRVRQPRHSALRQRIVMAKQLCPLQIEETGSYIMHRLRTATGGEHEPQVRFTPGAIREIHRITNGIPRLINVACDNCLLLGFVREVRDITPDMVHRVAEDMVPSFDEASAGQADQQLGLSLSA